MANAVKGSRATWAGYLSTVLAVGVLIAGGCQPDAVVSVMEGSQAISVQVGQEIGITLGNVGPGIYTSPPQISSSVLTYLGVDVVPPYTPAGPHQRFRFSAATPGRAIVEFRRTLGDATLAVVQDTVEVRP